MIERNQNNRDRYSEIISSLLSRSGGWKHFPNLKQELESWRPFWASLRKEDQQLFERALLQVWDYAEAIESSSKLEMNPTEAFLLAVILAQQKILDEKVDTRINEGMK